MHKFHAYPEDYAAAPLAWSASGFAPHRYRPAFEVVFAYDDVAGTLDIYFEGSKESVLRLWRLFAEVVLGVVDLPEPVKPAYGLERLKAPNPTFVRAADGEINDVRLKALTFAMLGLRSTTNWLETDVSDDPNALQTVIDRTFSRTAGDGRFALSRRR